MPEALIIRDVTLIDGNGATPVEGAVIAIHGGRVFDPAELLAGAGRED